MIKTIICPACDGNGKDYDNEETCEDCKGKGKITGEIKEIKQ